VKRDIDTYRTFRSEDERISHDCKHKEYVVYYPLDNRVAGWVLASIFYGMGVML
jgi:hypothetical protein